MSEKKITRFSDFNLKDELQTAIDEIGFVEPTPIQSAAIPYLLKGHDLVGVAATGTGKTLAYLLPILQKLDPALKEIQALVVCPTRELAIQVAGEAERVMSTLGLKVVLAYGGTSSGEQKRKIHDGCQLLVATPGRLLDFVGQAIVSLRRARFVVLDEADRMLDMGFIDDVDEIMRKSPMSRQTLLFSATFPPAIRELTERYMFDPKHVQMHVGTQVANTIDHAFYMVASADKPAVLSAIMRSGKWEKVLSFSARKDGTSDLTRLLRSRGFEVLALSSLLSQANRERALAAFRSGAFPVLVATDVAARGIDISDIDMVVNYDVPMRAEDYVHRIGRTGRAERSGHAVTLVCELDGKRVRQIEELLGIPVERRELEGFRYRPMPSYSESDDSKHRGRRPARASRGDGRSGGGRSRGHAGGRGRGKPAGSKRKPDGSGGGSGDGS